MSIQTEITRITQNVANTYAVLSALGADMPTEQNSDNLASTAGTAKAVLYSEQTLSDNQKSQARKNMGAVGETDISLGIASDGLIYIFVNGTPVGTGIPQGQSGDLFGYVDENNTIVLNGNLADGTYNIKYEMDDGSTVVIGDLVLDSNVYYTITNNLTNCISSNSTTQIVEGESYSATISANSGYELKSVVVTMGGSAVTVTDGVINIESVTGDIVITAVAEEVQVAEPTNFCVVNGDGWITNGRASSTGADRTDAGVHSVLTNYIAVQKNDVVYVKNADVYTTGSYSGIYKADKTALGGFLFTSAYPSHITVDNADSGQNQLTVVNADAGYIRLGCKPLIVKDSSVTGQNDPATDRYDCNQIIVNIKRNGEYL